MEHLINVVRKEYYRAIFREIFGVSTEKAKCSFCSMPAMWKCTVHRVLMCNKHAPRHENCDDPITCP